MQSEKPLSKLTFPERAVRVCVSAMQKGIVSPRIVSAVLKYDNVDVSPIEPFLFSSDDLIRKFAADIIGQYGNIDRLVDLAKVEKERSVLTIVMRHLGKRKSGCDLIELMDLLQSENPVIREEAITMFRRSGRADCLFGLLFDDDDGLVSRVKRYIEEADEKEEDKKTDC